MISHPTHIPTNTILDFLPSLPINKLLDTRALLHWETKKWHIVREHKNRWHGAGCKTLSTHYTIAPNLCQVPKLYVQRCTWALKIKTIQGITCQTFIHAHVIHNGHKDKCRGAPTIYIVTRFEKFCRLCKGEVWKV